MFRFNKKTKTKSGEEVIPFLVEGQKVYCFDGINKKKTIIKYLDDFDVITKEKIKQNKVVVPIVEMMDEIYKPEEKQDDKEVISDDSAVFLDGSAESKEVFSNDSVENIPKESVIDASKEDNVVVDLPFTDTSQPIDDDNYI